MRYMIYCIDKPGHEEVRAANRAAHLDYLGDNSGRIVMAGPTLAEDAESPTGSLLIMEFDSLAEAEGFAAEDPYQKADLFESVTIKHYRKVLPLA
jgi:uncharacterized protein YciI